MGLIQKKGLIFEPCPLFLQLVRVCAFNLDTFKSPFVNSELPWPENHFPLNIVDRFAGVQYGKEVVMSQ